MSASGCLFDFQKLNDVSKNVLSRMTAEEVYTRYTAWASEYDPEMHALLSADPAFAQAIFAIGRGGKKPRKDFTVWTDVRPYLDFFYDEPFAIKDSFPEGTDTDDVKAVITAFKASYDPADEMTVWFDKVKAIAASLGYAADMKAYKADPSAFKGSVADVSGFLRLAVTGKLNAPDLYTVMQLLGKDRVFARLDKFV